jgi:uncharacterized protein YjbI with pentapeptide repeats
MIEIRHRDTGKVLYTDSDAETVCDAVVLAVKGKATLRGANLYGSNLYGATLRGADLCGVGTVLSVNGSPSGDAYFKPTPDGWRIDIGCWRNKTIDELRELIAQDDGWPEAVDEEITERRPMLAALADMCEAWAAANADVLAAVVEKWGGQ